MLERLEELVIKACTALAIPVTTVTIEHPGELTNGDLATNVALVYAKQAGMSPKTLAEKIVAQIEERLPSYIDRITIAGPGFINFYLSQEFFRSSIENIRALDEGYGRSISGAGKTVLVEYSSPNIAKPFTIGHLRSTINGDAIARILETVGYTVIRDNHLGDWGTQFGKMIVALSRWGNIDTLNESTEPIKELVSLYVRFHEAAEKDPTLEDEARAWFVKLEHKDQTALEYWQLCISLSLKEFEAMYARLRVHPFDTMHGESFFEDKMDIVIDELNKKNLLTESDGAQLIFFPEETTLPPLMVRKRDGSSLYALRDLATDRWRKETYGPGITILNEVGTEQTEYFKQIFEAEAALGYFPKAQRIHVGHGLYRFKEGKMSTRKGNVIWLSELLTELEQRAAAINAAVAAPVALAALKFNDLRREASKDILFDWEEMLSLDGDSGPYLLYTEARARSLLRKAATIDLFPEALGNNDRPSTLERLLYRYPEVVKRAADDYAPHTVANFALEIARAFNSFYNEQKIIDPEHPETPYRLAVVSATHIVLRNALLLLGIHTVEAM